MGGKVQLLSQAAARKGNKPPQTQGAKAAL